MPFIDDVTKLIGSIEDALPEVNDLIGTVTGKPVSTTATPAVSTTGPVSTGSGTGTTSNTEKYIKWALTVLAVIVFGFFGWKAVKGSEKQGKKEEKTGAE